MTSLSTVNATQITLGYDTKVVLQDFDATIDAGEFIAILGPNGAGKTTLLKALLGLNAPLAGQLTVLGHAPHRNCEGVGYMPQQTFRLPFASITAYALLAAAMPSGAWGVPRLNRQQQAQIWHCLTEVGAVSFAKQSFMTLSGGQQRRIMLAAALLGQPRVLLLDEPLANLDLRYQEEFIDVLRGLCLTRKMTVLMTAHDVNPLLKALTRVLYLANGRGRLGSVDDILRSDVLSQLYQTPIEVIRYQQRLFVLHAESGHIDHADCHH